MAGANVLFFSRKCPSCQNLMKILENEQLISNFKLFCVDDNKGNIPPFIKMVPTMIVANVPKPLVAQETFNWVQQIKFFRQKAAMDTMQNQIIQQAMLNKMKELSGPKEYVQQEMSGISDSFSFVEKDKAFPHTYFGLGAEQKHTIFTVPEIEKKISKMDQTREIKNLENKRKDQDKNFEEYSKEWQLHELQKAQEKAHNDKVPF